MSVYVVHSASLIVHELRADVVRLGAFDSPHKIGLGWVTATMSDGETTVTRRYSVDKAPRIGETIEVTMPA